MMVSSVDKGLIYWYVLLLVFFVLNLLIFYLVLPSHNQ